MLRLCALCVQSTHDSRQLRRVSGFPHLADSLRLCVCALHSRAGFLHRHEAHDEIADRLRIFCADHSSFVHTIHAERLRILCSLVMNFADSLRLCALLMKTSQAFCTPLCTFCAPHSRKARSVSGRDEIADKFRLCAHSTHDKCGTPSPVVHFLCTPRNVSGSLHPHDEVCRHAQALCTFCAVHSRQLESVSGSLHPTMKFADSLRLCVCALHARKLRDASGFLHPHHEICGTSQALCPFCAFHSPKLRSVSGFVHPHDEVAESLRLWASSWGCKDRGQRGESREKRERKERRESRERRQRSDFSLFAQKAQNTTQNSN